MVTAAEVQAILERAKKRKWSIYDAAHASTDLPRLAQALQEAMEALEACRCSMEDDIWMENDYACKQSAALCEQYFGKGR